MSRTPDTSDTPPEPRRIVEALLFVGGPPLSAERASEIVRNLGSDQLRNIVDGLNRDYRRQRRPYAIQASDEGYTLSLRSTFRGVRERLAGSPREARLTTAARDVLALVAYRQPITKADIDSRRGTDSRGQLQQLVRLGLVAVVPQPELGPRDAVHVTTARFLELVGLNSLDDLPRTGDLQRL
jgi:segregation and condensation protein B